MAGKTVDLKFRADLSQLVAEMKGLTGMTETEAKKMAASLERQIKKAEKASVKAANATKKAWEAQRKALKKTGPAIDQTTAKFKKLESAGGETSSIMGGVASALDLVSPAAGDAARALGDAAGGAEMIARSGPSMIGVLGPVAVAALVAGVAFKKYSDELKEAEARMVAAAKRAQMVGAVFGKIKTERARVALELAVAEGEATTEDLVRFNAEQRTAGVFALGRADAVKQIATAQAALSVATKEQARLEDIITKGVSRRGEKAAFMAARQGIAAQNAQVAALTATLEGQRGAAAKIVDQEKEMTAQIIKRSAVLSKVSTGSRSATKATKTQIEQLQEATEKLVPKETLTKVAALVAHLERLQSAAASSEKAAAALAGSIEATTIAIADLNAKKAADELAAMVAEIDKLAPAATISRMAELEAAQRLINDAIAAGGNEAEELGKKLAQVNAAIRVEGAKTRLAMAADDDAKAKSAEEAAKKIEDAYRSSFASIATMSADIATTIANRAADEATAEVDRLAEGLDSREAMLEQERVTRAQLLEESAERDVSRELAASESKIAMLTTAAEAERAAMASAEAAKAKAVGDAFALSKALNLAEIAMSTAAAVVVALKVPPPAGFVLAGVVAALGATQAGLVASQEPPSIMHLGGIVGGPDERTITARAGEGVLTRQGVNAIGGEAGVASANRGQGGGAMVVQMVYKHKVLDEVLTDSVRRGGPIGSAINRRSPRGRRNPHGRRAS